MRDQGGGEAHQCPTCGEEFPTEEELRRHRDEVHSGDGGTRAVTGPQFVPV